MSTTLREAFNQHGMKAIFNGDNAVVVPISPDLLSGFDDGEKAKIGQEVRAGQFLVSVTKDGKRSGKLLNAFAGNEISFTFPRSDATEMHLDGTDMRRAAIALVGMRKEDGFDRERVAAKNAALEEKYEAAIARGETVDRPTPVLPVYADGAFSRVENFVDTVTTALAYDAARPLVSLGALNANIATEFTLGRDMSHVLSNAEMGKIREANELRREIGKMAPKHPDALAAKGKPYEAENAGAAASAAVQSIGLNHRHTATGGNAMVGADMEMMRALSGVMKKDVFASLTTTPVHQLEAVPLSADGFLMVEQELARNVEKDWSPTAIENLKEIFKDRMPSYKFDATFFTRDTEDGPADMLLVTDHTSAMIAGYLYAWDRASRVEEINIKDQILSTYTREDVPSTERMAELRAILEQVTFDNGEDIDFGLEQDDVLAGPRPAGY